MSNIHRIVNGVCFLAIGLSTSALNAQQPWPVPGYGAYNPQSYGQPMAPAYPPPLLRPQGLYDYYQAMSRPNSPYSPYARSNPNVYAPASMNRVNPAVPGANQYATPTSGVPYRPTSATGGPISAVAPTPMEYALPMQEVIGDAPTAPVAFHRKTNQIFWVTAEYLGSAIRPMQNQGPLATTGNRGNLIPGALGQPGTSVLFGDNINFGIFSGYRGTVGLFVDCTNRVSIEATGFNYLANTRTFFAAGDAAGNPVIARPVFNADNGFNSEGAFLASSPTLFTGSLAIEAKSLLSGGELNARFHNYSHECLHWDTLVGTRYLGLSESLSFRDQVSPIGLNQVTFRGAAVNPPNSLTDQDFFGTANQFFGGQIGARATWESAWLSIGGFAKVAVGATEETVRIEGSTTLITPTGKSVAQGGILALPTNIGHYRRTVFGIIPELGVDLGVDVTDHIRIKLGYSFLLWNHVVRPASQIDRSIAFGQAPGSFTFGTTTGPGRPAFRFNEETFWAQSLSAGLDVHY